VVGQLSVSKEVEVNEFKGRKDKVRVESSPYYSDSWC